MANDKELFDSGVLKRFPKLSVLKKDPLAVSIIEKMVPDRINGTGRLTTQRGSNSAPPADAMVRRVSDDTTRNINDASNIFQLLPDTELAMQILISSILSPKDMVNVEIGYRSNTKQISGELSGQLLEVIRKYFDETYKIKNILPNILKEILFTKGSYPLLVLPESTVDDIIHADKRVGMESIRELMTLGNSGRSSIGILGEPNSNNKSKFSMESWNGAPKTVTNINITTLPKDLNELITVSDNIEALKSPLVIGRARKERLNDILGIKGYGLESRKAVKDSDKITDEELTNVLYRNKTYSLKQYLSVRTPDKINKVSKGHPLVIKLPPEAVIPVHVPSDTEQHIGYFLLLDQYGNPLRRAREADYYYDLSRNIQSSNITSQLLAAGRRATEGTSRNSQIEESEAVRIYAEMVERDLVARLKNGVYGDDIEISRPLEVYRVMLARSLANMNTQILYVPAELVTYMAFDYNDFGVGKSLLDDNKILASIRAMLLFSNTMAAIKNSVGKTGLRIQLDPEDPDPSSTVERMIHEYSRHRQAAYPLGASNPLDIINFLQNAGIDIQVSGNDGYFETTLEVEDKSSNKVNIDSELDEDLKRKYFMSLGMSPETIDQSSDVEFAVSVVTSNLLLSKRVMLYQDLLTFFLREFISLFTINSSVLMDEMVALIESNKSSLDTDLKKMEYIDVIQHFLDTFEVTLPRPDSAKLENQVTAFNLYSDALEQAVDAYINEDMFDMEEYDDISEHIRIVRSSVIAHYKREWLRNNNVLPELMQLVNSDENGNAEFDLMEIQGSHMELIGKSIMKLLKKLKKDKAKREKQMEKLEAAALGEEEEELPAEEEGEDAELSENDSDEGGELDTEGTEEEEEVTSDEPEETSEEIKKPEKELGENDSDEP